MTAKTKKTVATVIIVLISIIAFTILMYVRASNGKIWPGLIGFVLLILPTLGINAIWKKEPIKKEI